MDSISRTIEITLLSAESLRLDGKPVKKDAVAVVRTDPLNSRSTRPDHEGGSNPQWNQKLEIEIPSTSRSVTVQIECRVGSGTRVIGSAAIPVSDFSGGYFPANYLHMLSYRLRDERGAKNGIVNVSVRVKGLGDYVLPPPVRKSAAEVYGVSSSYCSEPGWGTAAKGNSYGGGVAAGVPIWCGTGA